MSDPFELTDTAPPPPAPGAPTYLDMLNDTQRDAVQAVDGPVLVLAGAGTGKTRVLTTRLAHILISGKARPWEVLAVTFTNKAAREMRERVAGLLGVPVEGWWVGTFHATGARILRAHAEMVGLKPNFTILDDDDQVRLLKQVLEGHKVDDKRWPPRTLLGAIQRWKDRGLVPGKVPQMEAEDAADGQLAAIYGDYQERLTTLNAVDFGDLLLHCLTLFQSAPDILGKYQQRFRYILVDEYQDTNVAQYLWLRLLARERRNICCVGDDDQSIYSWRGAEVGNILRFEADFPGAQVVRLERNYRSTPHILAAASGLISHNVDRLGKTLWTEGDSGEKVTVHSVWDGEAEARYACAEMENLRSRGQSLNDMAVLVRAGFQTREFEERFITVGLPYRVLGGPRFYERQEIRDALAYLRVIAQPDDDLAFERIVNTPKRGVGPAAMQVIHGFARAERCPLSAAVNRLLETDEIRPKPRGALRDLMAAFDNWRRLVAVETPGDLCAMVLEDSGYADMWRAKKDVDAPGRLENLKELVAAMDEFDGLDGFLEHVSLVMENDESEDVDKVTLMTLHGAKGLEFDTVFLPGWEDGIFPHQRAMDDGGVGGLEEERRLAYVGLTRARKKAYVIHASSRMVYGKWQNSPPSRFVEELPEEHIQKTGERGLGGGGGFAGFGEDTASYSGFGRGRRNLLEDIPFEVTDVGPAARYEVGQRVFHQKFGYGRVESVDGAKLEVAFEKSGLKRVMDSFVDEA